MPKRIPRAFITYSRTEPARTIITIIAVVTFLAGLWIFTPWYVPVMSAGPTLVSLGASYYVATAINCAVCLPALHSAIKGKHNPEMIAKGAWYLFLWYTFVTMTRLVIYGFSNLYFVPVALIAMVLSVLYIEQRFSARAELV